MAINAKNSRFFMWILMIILSLGLAFLLPSLTPSNLFNRSDLPSQNTHEIMSLQEARSSYENEIQVSVQAMLDTWLGADKTKVSVHADMDFAQNEQTQELLDLDNPALSKAAGDDVEYTYSKQTISSSFKSGQVDTSTACSSLNIRPVQTASNVKPRLRQTGSTPRMYSVVSSTLKRP